MLNIFHPLPPNKFLNDYFEKEPLYIDRSGNPHFSGLISSTDFDRYFNRKLRTSDIRLAKYGETISPYDYTFEKSPKAQQTKADDLLVDVAKILSLYSRGYTVVAQDIDSLNDALPKLAQELERLFFGTVVMNAYLTAGNAQGFPSHVDDHDVLILQFQGSKDWIVNGQSKELSSESYKTEENLDIKWKGTLKSGDILYIPRGYPHSAKTGSESSGHLTIGIYTPKVEDFLKFIINEKSHSDVRYRHSMATKLQNEYYLIPSDAFADLTKILQDNQEISLFLRKYERKIISERRSRPLGAFLEIEKIREINLETIVQHKPNIFKKFEVAKTSSIIHFEGTSITFPNALHEMALYLFDSAEFSVNNIPSKIPLKEKIEIVKKLISDGFLVIKK